MQTLPRALSIAGSDSGGGAGIQADLKAFAACGVHGMTAITAVTAQNTIGVDAVHAIPPEMIIAQVRAVHRDIGIDAIKIGMLGDVATIEAVVQALAELPSDTPVVVDPVMVAESGAVLLERSSRAALVKLLVPRATVLTPNLPEAAALVDFELDGDGGQPTAAADPRALALQTHALGPHAVVLTGGHREQAIDIFYDGDALHELGGERYPGGATHGSGCTHSAVLAARLAWGDTPLEAARWAKELASAAVRDGLAAIGGGAGPVDVLGVMDRSEWFAGRSRVGSNAEL
ncbi:MAG: bifunctional hydroxymethylpyrimidine kinase/phosphomethylpyrimidine kinase [Solirubrobacterales bacterium]|nr:bifunctional hydroxymethylpyrimidine kinase/phosphomethylpyrimidine kinase [Solirubrobacterales bacterium]